MNDWQKVEAILAGALDCAPAERAAYLEANCAGDAELRKEIQSLLAEQDDAAHFLESSVAHLAAAMLPADNSAARVGSSLGAYKIIKEIGRGGMGVVYLAARGRRVSPARRPQTGQTRTGYRRRAAPLSQRTADSRQPPSSQYRQQENSETAELATNLNGLGNFLMEKGELAEAQKNLIEAETIYRKLFNQSYLPLGDNLRFQSQVLYLLGNIAEAEKKINETLEIYRQNARPQFINYPTALTIQGLIFNQLGKSVAAEKLLREAVNIRRENMPETHFLRALADGALGEFLVSQGRFAEAEPLLLKSYENLQITQSPESPRLITALKRAVELYEKWQKPELAAEYRVKLSG